MSVDMHRDKQRLDQAGFTLLELLVALGLMGIVMGAVLSLNVNTGRATSALQARSELTSETQIAQNYIAGKIRSAVYVYPYGASNYVASLQFANSGYSTYNASPRAGFDGNNSYNWRYGAGDGTDPLIAFILPPAGPPNNLCATSTTTDAKEQNCYAFYAYYAIPRASLVNGAGAGAAALTLPSGANRLPADSNNDSNVWALMEYRSYFTGSGYSISTSSGFTTGGTGRLVLDYLRPTTQIGTDKLFIGGVGTTSAPPTSVTINLATTRQIAGQTVNVPGTGRYSITVYPRNLGAVPYSNN